MINSCWNHLGFLVDIHGGILEWGLTKFLKVFLRIIHEKPEGKSKLISDKFTGQRNS